MFSQTIYSNCKITSLKRLKGNILLNFETNIHLKTLINIQLRK
jgi:hypothetical protein